MEHTYRSSRYRLLPRTRAGHQRLMQVTGACVWTWNRMLAHSEQEHMFHERLPWLVDKPSTTFFSLGKEFTRLRAETDWLRELPFAAVRHTLKHQAEAWRKFFKGQGGRPRFKSKYSERTVTFPEPGHFQIQGGSLRLQKLGWFRLARRGGDPYGQHEARSVTVKRECGKWYAVVLYRVPAHVVERADDGRAVGVDMNVGQVACSDGEIMRMDGARMGRLEARRRRYQRRMARQVKGSNRRNVTKRRLAKVCRNIRCHRDNWQHHASKRIAGKAGTVAVESLGTKGMTASAKGDADNPGRRVRQKAGLNRSILNTGWHGLKAKLEYKSARLIEVNPKHTSQRCAKCGFTDKGNRTTQASFECLACGHRDNADVNAALNILALGTGATGRGGGEVTRPVKRQDIAGHHLVESCI